MKKFLAYLEKQIHPSDKKPLVQTVEIICENHATSQKKGRYCDLSLFVNLVSISRQ